MASPISQIEDQDPIISDVPIVSKGEGAEDLARGLGSFAGSIADITTEKNQLQSKTMMSQSIADMENLKANTQVQMIQNPGAASDIADKANETAQSILNNAFVNKEDRNELNKYITSSSGQLTAEGATREYEVNRRTSAYNFYYSLQDNLNAYRYALTSGDQASAQAIEDSTLANAKGLVATGAIRPEQAASIITNFHGQVAVANDHAAMFGDPSTKAAQYNANQSSPLTNQPTVNNVNNPINGNTDALNQYHYGDRTFQDMTSAVSTTGTLPATFAMAFDQLKPEQRQHLIYQSNGVRLAQGDIWSGTSIPVLQSKLNDIDAKGSNLSIEEKGYSDTVKNYLYKLNNGDFMGAIGSTPIGGKILQDYQSQQASIAQSTMTDQQKNQAIIHNENDTVNKLVSYGQSLHLPGRYIQPINTADVATAQSSFAPGGNPNQALNTMGMYSNQNKVYVAQAMKDPTQKVVLNTIALARDMPLTQQQDYIASNQDGQNFNSILMKANIGAGVPTNSDKGIMATISASPQFKNAMNIIQNQYDSPNVPTIQASLGKSLVNYVKYQATKNNDLSMNNLSTYINNATSLLNNAYEPQTGTNYQINNKQMNLSSSDASALAAYSVNQGYQYIGGKTGNVSRMLAADRNPLKMVISPQNEVLAVDGNNNVYWRQPFTPAMLSAAREFAKSNQGAVSGSIANNIFTAGGNQVANQISKEAQQNPLPNLGQ